MFYGYTKFEDDVKDVRYYKDKMLKLLKNQRAEVIVVS